MEHKKKFPENYQLVKTSSDFLGTNSRNAHPAEALCEGALEMFAYDESNRIQEHAINIGQNNDGRFPYGYRKIMPTKDFSSHSLFVKVNGNCCWKLFTR